MIDQDLAQETINLALSRGAEFVELFAEDKRGMAAGFDDGKVEELSSGRDRGVGVRAIRGETTGYAYTSEFSKQALFKAAEAASSIAIDSQESKSLSVDLHWQSKADPRVPGGSIMWPESVAKADKVRLLELANKSARAQGSDIAQVSCGYADSRRKILVANSNGLWATDDQVRTRFMVSCVAVGDTGMQMGFEVAASTRGFEHFEEVDVEELARLAAERAIRKLSAKPAPTGPMPVVIKGGSGGILFHEACGHGLEADHIVKGTSVYANRIGELVASDLVTLVDDGTVSGEWGTYSIDDEGKPACRNVLIENGLLVDYMWDGCRASRQGRDSSGNGRRQSYQHLPMVRMTNTYILGGTSKAEDIISDTDHGIYVAKLGGGQVDTATGDFVFGMVEAYLIEDGQITTPLRDANLIGNGPEILKKVDCIADDFATTPGTCGKDGQQVPVGCGQPTLRISEITIGGTSNG